MKKARVDKAPVHGAFEVDHEHFEPSKYSGVVVGVADSVGPRGHHVYRIPWLAHAVLTQNHTTGCHKARAKILHFY